MRPSIAIWNIAIGVYDFVDRFQATPMKSIRNLKDLKKPERPLARICRTLSGAFLRIEIYRRGSKTDGMAARTVRVAKPCQNHSSAAPYRERATPWRTDIARLTDSLRHYSRTLGAGHRSATLADLAAVFGLHLTSLACGKMRGVIWKSWTTCFRHARFCDNSKPLDEAERQSLLEKTISNNWG